MTGTGAYVDPPRPASVGFTHIFGPPATERVVPYACAWPWRHQVWIWADPPHCCGDGVAIWTMLEGSWSEVRDFLTRVDGLTGDDAYPIDIIDSVVTAGADGLLAIDTSMHDLVVAPAPAIAGAETDVIIVCARGSMRPHPPRTVRIDFEADNGKTTSVVRPSKDALPLFWRFAELEFGVRRHTISDQESLGRRHRDRPGSGTTIVLTGALYNHRQR